MVCIYCGQPTAVTNSRHQKRNNTIWRRRTCKTCAQIFTTIERPDLFASIVIRSNDMLHGFNRDTLFVSIYEACKHRSDALSDATELTQTILGVVLHTVSPQGTLERSTLAKTAHSILERFDTTAAAVYRAYHTID